MLNIMAARLIAQAAKLYAAAPSHAPLGADPAKGTVCAVYALQDAEAATDAAADTAIRDTHVYVVAIRALEKAAGEDIVVYNAEHTTEEVLAVFAKAEAELCR